MIYDNYIVLDHNGEDNSSGNFATTLGMENRIIKHLAVLTQVTIVTY